MTPSVFLHSFPSVVALGLPVSPVHFAATDGFLFLPVKLQREFKGIWIPAQLWMNPDLSVTEKALIAEIESLDNGDGCYASNEYLAAFMGVSEGRLRNILSDLGQRGFIESFAFDGRRRKLKQTAYCVTTAVTKTLRQETAITDSLQPVSRNRDSDSSIGESKVDIPNPIAPEAGAEKQPDGRHREITQAWGQAYSDVFGMKYAFNGRDAATLKRFLASSEETAEGFLKVAKEAWERTRHDRFAKRCQNAATIHGLCTFWNDVRVELQTPATTPRNGAPARNGYGSLGLAPMR